MDENTEKNMEANIETPMAPVPQEEKGSTSSVIGILVIVLVLAFGAFYFLKQVPTPTEGILTPAEKQADSVVSNLSEQGTSTDLDAIQADINATDFSGIDTGLSDIQI